MPIFDARLIPKCHDRLEKAKQALYECRNSLTIDEYRSKFAAFLIDTGSILNALDAGAKFTPQAKQWYGSVKRAGRADPLVSYMHQARNTEEHGVEQVTGHNLFAQWGIPPTFGFRDKDTGEIEWLSDQYRPQAGDKRTMVIGAGPMGPVLRPIRDERFGNVFKAPEEHQGKKLNVSDPINIAEIYLLYLTDLISQAESIS